MMKFLFFSDQTHLVEMKREVQFELEDTDKSDKDLCRTSVFPLRSCWPPKGKLDYNRI